MAEDFNAYRNPRLAEAVRRAYGEDLDVGTFAPELAAILVLENDRYENRLLQGLRYWSTGLVVVAANAGNVSRLQVHNPANSGVIVVVEGFVIFNPLAVVAFVVTRDGALAGTPTANLALDTRVALAASERRVASLNRIDNTLPAVSGTRLDQRTATVNIDVIFNFRNGPMSPIVLAPNTVAEVVCGTVNTAINAFAFGYERQARPEELVVA